jgi:glutathione S-transferase
LLIEHRLNKSRAHRILWLLEELKIDYDVKIYHRLDNNLAPPELKEIHPLGKSPLIGIEREGQKPLILAESGLIIEYLIEHFGPKLAPKHYQDGHDQQVAGETEAYMRNRWYR